jgi:hypothetical protein
MKLEGKIEKNVLGNIGKSIGAKVSKLLYGDNGYGPRLESLLNAYSLIGPEYINNKYFPIGRVSKYGNYGPIGALEHYKDRVGLNNNIVSDLIMDLNVIAGVNVNADNYNHFTRGDFNNMKQLGFDRWYPNRYKEQYENVLRQLTPIPDYNNGTVNVRGTYHNTLPAWMQRFTHPLQVDINY